MGGWCRNENYNLTQFFSPNSEAASRHQVLLQAQFAMSVCRADKRSVSCDIHVNGFTVGTRGLAYRAQLASLEPAEMNVARPARPEHQQVSFDC